MFILSTLEMTELAGSPCSDKMIKLVTPNGESTANFILSVRLTDKMRFAVDSTLGVTSIFILAEQFEFFRGGSMIKEKKKK